MNLLSLAILTLFSLLFFSATHQSKERTLVSNPILRLSSRRKRSLLFPNYGSIKVTVGISKGLIGNNPKGLSLSYEMCSYYAGPTAFKDLLNGIRHQKKPKQEDIPNKIKNLSIEQSFPNLSDAYFSTLSSNSSYNQPPFKAIHHRSKNIQRLIERSSSRSKYVLSRMIDIQRKSPLKLALDYLLGPDAKCGILNSICKSKEFLLAPGYSMIHDIVRTIGLSLEKGFTSGGENSIFCEDELYPECKASLEKGFTSGGENSIFCEDELYPECKA